MALAQAREIDAILVTELSRWGRSTQDLVQTLDDLHSWKVSVLAQTGLSFDLGTSSGSGVKLGRQPGQRPSDKKAKRVLELHREGLSYRLIGRNLGLSKNTVMEIVKRAA
jgi:DNA invertase Pin-like site-specific DNA recombinase